jgi:hypothetical protein
LSPIKEPPVHRDVSCQLCTEVFETSSMILTPSQSAVGRTFDGTFLLLECNEHSDSLLLRERLVLNLQKQSEEQRIMD